MKKVTIFLASSQAGTGWWSPHRPPWFQEVHKVRTKGADAMLFFVVLNTSSGDPQRARVNGSPAFSNQSSWRASGICCRLVSRPVRTECRIRVGSNTTSIATRSSTQFWRLHFDTNFSIFDVPESTRDDFPDLQGVS